MAERRSILANLAALVTGQVIALALGLVTHAIMARALGPSDYGVLGFGVAVLSYFGIVTSLGTDIWGMREIAADRARARDVAGAIVSLRLALSVVAALGVLVLVVFWDRPPVVSAVVLIQSASLFAAALTLDFAYQGLERMDAVARRQVTTAVIALAGVAASLGLGGGVIASAAVLQAAAVCGALAMAGEFAGLIGWPRVGRAAIALWRRVLRESAPLAVTTVVVTVYASIDIVMLGFWRPSEEVGFYVASVRIMVIGLGVAAVFRTAFAPVLARLMANASARNEAGRHHASAVVTTGGLGAVLGFVLAPEILVCIYGAAFAPAAGVFRILMANLLVACAVEIFHTQLVAWRLQSEQMWIMVAGALVNIALNFALIPPYGMDGAAAATLVSTLLVLGLAGAVLRRRGFEIHGYVIARAALLALIVAAVGAAALHAVGLGGPWSRLVVAGVALTVLYGGASWLSGIFRPAETFGYFSRRA